MRGDDAGRTSVGEKRRRGLARCGRGILGLLKREAVRPNAAIGALKFNCGQHGSGALGQVWAANWTNASLSKLHPQREMSLLGASARHSLCALSRCRRS
jgi:hypothetical protein